VVAAFLQALDEHAAEGGVAGRGRRYAENRDVMVAGLRALGFETLLQDGWLSPIIVTFFNPAHPKFQFQTFYDLLKARGFIIYPGKLTVVDSFRIGCIGCMDAAVMRRLVAAVADSLHVMGVDDATPPAAAMDERAKLVA
jgi:2-aminoethylphosphonate-pyruvate transaminase